MSDPALIRLSIFIGVFVICAYAEHIFPRKRLTQVKSYRWFNNISLIITNSLIIALIMPIIAIDVALLAEKNQWGLFNVLNLPKGLTLLLCLISLDAIIYWQHRLFHKIPMLWRLHRVHHADQDIDVTTGIRFHPIEIIFSMIIKCVAVLLLGVPVVAVILFEILLNACALFNHSNLKLPLSWDKYIRLGVVTPDMHRVHHSIYSNEMHRNFGFCLSVWDRVFHSYTAQPKQTHKKMLIGLPYFRHTNEQKLSKMLTQPFRTQSKSISTTTKDEYPLSK